jgi:hypothetical protein
MASFRSAAVVSQSQLRFSLPNATDDVPSRFLEHLIERIPQQSSVRTSSTALR